jgi:hypothetical protein
MNASGNAGAMLQTPALRVVQGSSPKIERNEDLLDLLLLLIIVLLILSIAGGAFVSPFVLLLLLVVLVLFMGPYRGRRGRL